MSWDTGDPGDDVPEAPPSLAPQTELALADSRRAGRTGRRRGAGRIRRARRAVPADPVDAESGGADAGSPWTGPNVRASTGSLIAAAVAGATPAPAGGHRTGPPRGSDLPDPERGRPVDGGHLRVQAATGAVLAVLFLLGAGLAWWSMPAGPLSGNDSVTYLAVARNLAEGKGLTSPFGHELTGLSPAEGVELLGATPLTAWPPLYPVALASGVPAGFSVETISRLLNVVACGATVVLTVLLARRMGGSVVAGALAAVAVLVGYPVALTFAAAGSEALFLPLVLISLWALARVAGRYPGHPANAADLVVVVVASSAATLTRWAGVTLVATAVVVFLASGRHGRHGARTGLAIAGAALAVPTAVLLWTRSRPGWRAEPLLVPRVDDLPDAARTASRWFIPWESTPGWAVALTVVVAVAAGVGAAVAVILGRNRALSTRSVGAVEPPWRPAERTARERRAGVGTVATFVATYALFLGISGSYFDHAIPFDSRLALPMFPPVMALLAAGADAAARRPARAGARVAVIAAVLVPALALIGINAADTRVRLWTNRPEGVWSPVPGYPAMDAVAALPTDVVVFANQPSATYALSGRPVLALPLVRSPMTGIPNPEADRDLDQLVSMLTDGRAAVVIDLPTRYLHGMEGSPPMVGEEELRARVPLRALAVDDRFVVLVPAGPPAGGEAGAPPAGGEAGAPPAGGEAGETPTAPG